MDMKEQIKLKQWAADMAEQKELGMTKKQWAEYKGMSVHGYEYRCRRVRKAMQDIIDESSSRELLPAKPISSSAEFARIEVKALPEENTFSGINVRLAGSSIHIAPDSNEEHIRLILEVLSNAQ